MWNDAPSYCFGSFEFWLGWLARPHRLDDEPCPEEFRHIGDWEWTHALQDRYGADKVERVTPKYLTADRVYLLYIPTEPFPTDTCRYTSIGHDFCDGSCKHDW